MDWVLCLFSIKKHNPGWSVSFIFPHTGVSQHKCFKCYNHIFISYSIKIVFSSYFFIIIMDHVIGLKFKDHSSLNKRQQDCEKYSIKKEKQRLSLLSPPSL